MVLDVEKPWWQLGVLTTMEWSVTFLRNLKLRFVLSHSALMRSSSSVTVKGYLQNVLLVKLLDNNLIKLLRDSQTMRLMSFVKTITEQHLLNSKKR